MTNAFSKMSFRHNWRQYQTRALRELDKFRDDKKIHIVAAPGAGKTVLGLEIMRRLKQRTLVLAPTNLICDQWLQRLRHDFLDGILPDWVTTKPIRNASLYVCTYQYFFLHHKEFNDCFDVIILDEAHHLRNAWWEVIFASIDKNNDIVVSLTATPPIDSDDAEWRRYNELCGEVDIEISPPELVLNGDLCPYQDLLYIVPETAEDTSERIVVEDFHKRLSFCMELANHISSHHWFKNLRRHAAEILEAPEQFVARIIYLRANNFPIPNYARKLLGIKRKAWPDLDKYWLTVLLNAELENLPNELLELLIATKALKHNQISLDLKQKDRSFNVKAALEAINTIVSHERENLKDNLRCALLTDHVGKLGFHYKATKGDLSTSSLFNLLWDDCARNDLAVVTGSCAVLPIEISEGLAGKNLEKYPGYKFIEGQTMQSLNCAEKALSTGKVSILIGTRSLLGQGWDFPALNTLILATKASSYVSTNQLRGRVMRKNPKNPEKIANIWHLTTAQDGQITGEALKKISRRFGAFSRLFRAEKQIRSGLPAEKNTQNINQVSFAEASSRGAVSAEWNAAFQGSHNKDRFLREITCVEFRMGECVFPIRFSERILSLFGNNISDKIKARAFRRIVKATIEGLRIIDRIHTKSEDLSFTTHFSKNALSFQVLGATQPEELRIHKSIKQIIGPIENPRYLLQTKSLPFQSSKDYFCLPDEFSRHRKSANIFAEQWNKYVATCEAKYTRSSMGRVLLLTARLNCPATRVEQNKFWS